MPAKYAIHTGPVSDRYEPVSRSGIIAWEEGCLKCPVCVKTRCVYGVYERRGLRTDQMIESIDNQCMNCLRCVQSCPGELIHKSVNPEYEAMGDSYWMPDIISKLWSQAETGKIPVSGAGYAGAFSGPGFDSMWTDMSEIVRPTRDGIHGREYISTAVDLGSRQDFITFKEDGSLAGKAPEALNLPMPILFRVPPFGDLSPKTLKGWSDAAMRLGTLMALPGELIEGNTAESAETLIPVYDSEFEKDAIPEGVRVIEIPWSEGWKRSIDITDALSRGLLVSVRIPIKSGVEDAALSLARGGVSIIHLEGSSQGRYVDDESRYLMEAVRSVHMRLVEDGVRDRASLVVSGGIAMAEHVAKGIICGADAVYVDLALLIALECRMCRRCEKGVPCPVEIASANSSWVAGRVINLMGAWHSQLLEVMGAMGIRDARRLRGETGRAMFFEELDRSTFEEMCHVEEGCEIE